MSRFKINRVFNDLSTLGFKVKFPDGKSMSDVEDAIFIIKADDDTPYAQRILDKTLISGSITTSPTKYFNVNWIESDYDNLNIGETYRAALFLKWNGEPDYDENIEHFYDFEIKQNFHND